MFNRVCLLRETARMFLAHLVKERKPPSDKGINPLACTLFAQEPSFFDRGKNDQKT